jgi:hypothetical protein
MQKSIYHWIFLGAALILTSFRNGPDKVYLSANVLANKQIKISWVVPAAYRSGNFVIQRSTDLKRYVEVGYAEGSFNAHKKSLYNFVDKDADQGIFYYRLVETFEDGSSKVYSSIAVSVENTQTAALNMAFEQNATGEQRIYLTGILGKNKQIHLIESRSQTPIVFDLQQNSPNEVVLIPLFELSEGAFKLQIQQDSGIQQFNFVVKEGKGQVLP